MIPFLNVYFIWFLTSNSIQILLKLDQDNLRVPVGNTHKVCVVVTLGSENSIHSSTITVTDTYK